jgi:acyl-CoA thioester hydrolase
MMSPAVSLCYRSGSLSGIGKIEMSFAAPFMSSVHKVEDAWIDYNGHFNMAYYNVIFDRAGDEAFELLGLGGDYARETNCSFFTLEAHITYLRELHAGDEVKVSLQVLDHDAKRVHYVEQMFHAAEGWLSAVSEHMVIHVDMTAKKSSPFPESVLQNLALMHEAHRSLPVPPQVGHRIGIPRRAPA